MKNTSLNDLADMIISQVQSGLKSVTNHGLSKSQVKDEIIQVRDRMLPEAIANGLINTQQLYQDLIIEKFERHGESEVSNKRALVAVIPEILELELIETVEYIGSTDGYEGYKVIKGKSNQFLSYDRYTAKVPVAWIKSKKILIYNDNPRRLLIRAIFSNPRDLGEFDPQYGDSKPFPSCNALKDMIVGKIVNDYYRYYRMANPQPNTQTEINQTPSK